MELPPPFETSIIPPTYNDILIEELKREQLDIKDKLEQLLSKKDIVLSKATQDTIKNILFIFEHRFDTLERELHNRAKWLEIIPIIQSENIEIKKQMNEIKEEFDMKTKEFDIKLKEQSEEFDIKLKDVLVEEKSNPVIDRWTDPKNIHCTRNYFNILKPLVPLPKDVNIQSISGGDVRHFPFSIKYSCRCFNCLLLYKKGWTQGPVSSPLNRPTCPLDSDCTCLTNIHRIDFFHSIELGIIKGRDLELDDVQKLYLKITCVSNKVHSNDDLFDFSHLQFVKKDKDTDIFNIIQNCIKEDGVNIYEYVRYLGGREFKWEKTTSEDLYLKINKIDKKASKTILYFFHVYDFIDKQNDYEDFYFLGKRKKITIRKEKRTKGKKRTIKEQKVRKTLKKCK